MYMCIYVILCAIYYHFYKLKNEENNHEGVLFLVKLHAATLLKVTLLDGCFSRFLNCTNGTKSCNVPHTCKVGMAYGGQNGLTDFNYFLL